MNPIHAPTPPHRFMRGAIRTPQHRLLALVPYRVVNAPPPQFGIVPAQLDVWGNQTYGDCVTAEEAFAKAWWSSFCGLPELFIPTSEVIRFADQNGFLNGAMLTDVMDVMQRRDGFNVGGKLYLDGSYYGVDYSNELVMQAAIDPSDGNGGPVKIAIDAAALPSGAGNQQGWFATSGRQYTNTDHCVSVAGYGRADYLYDLLRVSLPSGLSPATPGYLLFTWGTIGFVTHDWLMGTCTEAYVRNPTTPGQSPTPGPTPIPPVPIPPVPPSPPSPPVPPTPVPVMLYGQTEPFALTFQGPLGRIFTATHGPLKVSVQSNPTAGEAMSFRVHHRIHSLFRAHFVNAAVRRKGCTEEVAGDWYDANVTDAVLHREANKAGLDLPDGATFWEKVKAWLASVDWAKVFQIIEALISLFMMFAGPGPQDECSEAPGVHPLHLAMKPANVSLATWLKLIALANQIAQIWKADSASGKSVLEITTDILAAVAAWLATNPLS